MRILLDTHSFIWWNGELHKLSPKAYALCHDSTTTLILSYASIWEIQIKHQLGKINLNNSLRSIVQTQQMNNDLELLPIQPEHIYALD